VQFLSRFLFHPSKRKKAQSLKAPPGWQPAWTLGRPPSPLNDGDLCSRQYLADTSIRSTI
jgi:hypothetical protein